MHPEILPADRVTARLKSLQPGREPIVLLCEAGEGVVAAVSCGLAQRAGGEVLGFAPLGEATRLLATADAVAMGLSVDWFRFFDPITLDTGRYTITPKLVSPVHRPSGIVASLVDGLGMQHAAFFEMVEMQPEGPYRVRNGAPNLRSFAVEVAIGLPTCTEFAEWKRMRLPGIVARAHATTVLHDIMDAAWPDKAARAA